MKLGKSAFGTTLIVLGTIGLAAAPVVADQFRTEVARWYLAEATNRISFGEDSTRQIEQARVWAEDLPQLRDYWIFRAEQALASSPREVASIIAEAVKAHKANYDLASLFAERLANAHFFSEAVAVLQAGTIPEFKDHPSTLNNLAYYRALAGVDLDQALADINQALNTFRPSYLARDTRAWILFNMGKPQLALEDADFAVKAATNRSDAGWLDQSLMWLEDSVLTPREPKSDTKILTRREAGEQLWSVATIIYHRAKILEALGRNEAAQKDFQWLTDRNLPTDDSLF
jgi:tetratricopeptide (TPR) repeat protein